jgi:predicted HAD superfamily Cof-like phosphohydrolase
MLHEQNQVKEFMLKAGQATPDRPTMPAFEVRLLRFKLIWEELNELANSFGCQVMVTDQGLTLAETSYPDLTEAYDAILDLMVVVIGTGVALGLQLEPGWEEVHRTNLAKFAPGGHLREDGKFIKPPGWKPPELAKLMSAQTAAAAARDLQLPLT